MAMSRKGSLIGIIVLFVVLAIGAFFYFGNDSQEQTNEEDIIVGQPNGSGTSSGNTPTRSFVVTITDSGYSPETLTVNIGDVVIWKNEGTTPNWPASAMHPTHRVYPGSDIEKCSTDESNIIFDACRGLETGEEWSFTFHEVGTWSYHNHLNAQKRGTIIVQ